MKKIRKILSALLAVLMIIVIGLGFLTNNNIAAEATSATTYTRTINSDSLVIRSQDGFLPASTYDRIGLTNPTDMVIDTVMDDLGNKVEYGYVLNRSSGSPFLTKFDLNDVTNYSIIDLTAVPYMKAPTGLWIQTTTVSGVTRKEMYIADSEASYVEEYQGYDITGRFVTQRKTYTGLIYRIQFDPNDENALLLDQYEIIHVPVTTCPTVNPNACALDEEACTSSLCAEGQLVMNTPSFGQDTIFNPKKVAVDSSGNIFIASEGTSAGMIQLSYTGDFVSFFIVNSVNYDFLYQLIKKYGTAAQLSKLNYEKPASFFNVFIDKSDLVYSVSKEITTIFNKYSTSGSTVLENALTFPGLSLDTDKKATDAYITKDGLMFITISTGLIYVYAPDGSLIFYFGTKYDSNAVIPDIVGFFKSLEAITVDSQNRIWAVDSERNFVQTFTPTEYAQSIFKAIISFNNHDYETSRKAWEDVLQYDSLSILANDGLGKAYYYDMDFDSSLQYFKISKNRSLYSNVFWELRNDFLQQNLTMIVLILIGVIIIIFAIKYAFKKVPKLATVKGKLASIKESRLYKDLTVGFRLIKKPNDTFYELKVNRRGSVLGATIYYILFIIAFILNTYCYHLPFQVITINNISVMTVLFGAVAVLFVFILCNYLVSAINDGEGTFKDIYKFTGYCLLPMIILLPISVGISYGLTLNEKVILSILKALAFWGSGILLVIGILETHNYTFKQTVKNILLTLVFMILFAIIVMVIYVMFDQIVTLIEQIWKEVKLRAGWY